MNFKLKTAAAAILAASLVVSYAYASDANPPAKKHVATKKAKTPPGPTVEEQIQSLRQEFQGQIDGLKSNLADKDAQLKQAQQAAADAQAAAAKAQAAADAQQQAVADNAAAASTLKATVDDMRNVNAIAVGIVHRRNLRDQEDHRQPRRNQFQGHHYLAHRQLP